MGLLNKLFGGGTKLAISLDSSQVPAGGVLSGTLTLTGGKKDLTLTALKVRLLHLLVRQKEGSSLPEIDTNLVVDHTLCEGEPIPKKSTRDFEFRFELPNHLDPSGDGVSYTVMAVADIPKVADPTAKTTLTVVEGGMSTGFTLDDCYKRWPDLRSTDPEAQCEALREVMLECYSARDHLQVLEPELARLLRKSTGDVRTQALETWANLLDGHARKEHIKLLRELISAGGDDDFRRELITAAAKFAEEGALPLIKELAKSPDAKVREQVADQLRFAAEDKFRGKLGVLESMADDPEPAVRAAVIGAYSDYRDKKKLMKQVAQKLDSDPSPEVQAACISTLCLLHDYKQGPLAVEMYQKHLKNPNRKVRQEIAENLHWFPKTEAATVQQMAEQLLSDNDAEVRRKMAWYCTNMHKFPGLSTKAKQVAANDPDAKVRGDMLSGMQALLPTDQLVAFYRERLATDANEHVAWGVYSGLNHDEHKGPQADALMRELASCPFESVASSARNSLEG